MLIVVPIKPVPKARARTVQKGGRTWSFTPKKTLDFEKELQTYVKSVYRGQPLNHPLMVWVSYYIKKPKTCKRDYPTTRPDGDNYMKSVQDSLNGILWTDDSIIIDGRYSKLYSPTDKEFIVIWIGIMPDKYYYYYYCETCKKEFKSLVAPFYRTICPECFSIHVKFLRKEKRE